jgi:hypothetical protein
MTKAAGQVYATRWASARPNATIAGEPQHRNMLIAAGPWPLTSFLHLATLTPFPTGWLDVATVPRPSAFQINTSQHALASLFMSIGAPQSSDPLQAICLWFCRHCHNLTTS